MMKLGSIIMLTGFLTIIISSIVFEQIKPTGNLSINSESELNIPHKDNRERLERLAVINKPIKIKISSVSDRDAVPIINRIVNDIRHNKGYVKHISHNAFHDSAVPTIRGMIPISYLYDFRNFVESNNIIVSSKTYVEWSGYYLSDKDFNRQNQYINVEIDIRSPIFERKITPIIIVSSLIACFTGFLIWFYSKPSTKESIDVTEQVS